MRLCHHECRLTLIYFQVIEHVANPSGFCESLSALTVPNGATVISTINRSMRAYATAIVAAEYILNWVSLYLSSIFWPHTLRYILHCVVLCVGEKNAIPSWLASRNLDSAIYTSNLPND